MVGFCKITEQATGKYNKCPPRLGRYDLTTLTPTDNPTSSISIRLDLANIRLDLANILFLD